MGRELRVRIYLHLHTATYVGDGEVGGVWRRLHEEELRNLYESPNIIRLMKSRRMRWAGM